MGKFKKGIRRALSHVMVLVLTTAAAISLPVPMAVYAALPHENEEGYHYEEIDEDVTYNIVRKDEIVDGLYRGCCPEDPSNPDWGKDLVGNCSGKGYEYGYYDHEGIFRWTGDKITDTHKACTLCGREVSIGSVKGQISGTKTVHEHYSAWVPNTYTVKYSTNGGSGTMGSQSCTYDTEFTIESNGFMKSGYKFTGWNTNADGSGTSYSAGASVKNLTSVDGGTVTLYAQWTADTFTQTLKFYKNGTYQSSKTYDVKNGETFNAASHVGDVTFDHCHCSKIDTESWTVSGEAYTNVYYVWDTLKVAYYGNGSTGGSTDGCIVNYGSQFTVAQNSFTKTGHSFAGWNTKSDGSGTSYTVGGTYTAKPSRDGEALELYAQWSTNSYTVTVNKGTGISSVSGGGAYKYNSNVTINSAIDTGYRDPYWKIEIVNAPTSYIIDGLDYANVFDPVFYYTKYTDIAAKYGPNTVSLISHFYNYGIYERRQASKNFDINKYMNSYSDLKSSFGDNILEYFKHYILYGKAEGRTAYNSDDSDEKIWETPHSFLMPANDLVFTAYASPESYTVTFNANEGTSNLSEVTVTFDSSNRCDVSEAVNKRDGYEFAGWNTKADGTGTAVWDKDGHAVSGTCWSSSGSAAKWKYAGNLTVYAIWKDTTPPVLSVSPTSTGGEYVKSVELTITASDNEALSTDNAYQYCLSTNSTTPVGTWQNYVSGQSFTAGGNLSGTYYLWVKKVKDTTGNASSSSAYHKYGSYYFDNTPPDLSKILSSYPDRVQIPYGWFSEGTNIQLGVMDAHSGIQSIILSDFTGTQNIDITESRSFFFDTTGVSFYCITATDNLGNSLKKPFIVKIDKEGVVIPENAVWKGLENQLNQNALILLARWNPNTYTVRFDRNDDDGGSTRATGTMPDITLTYDKRESLPLNLFERVGYEFKTVESKVMCWNTSADGTAQSFSDGALVNSLTTIPGGSITLYTQWSPKEYTLTFDYNRPEAATGELKNADEESRSVFFDSGMGTLPEPCINGWEFDGWYDEDNVKLSATDIWHYTSDVTAHAEWTVARYEVRLHSMVPSDALPSLVRKSPSGWTWNSAGYYSAMFTYDAWNTLPSPDSVYGLTEYSIEGWYQNSMCTTYVGSGTRLWNLSGVNGGIVNLYPLWRDTTGPRIMVTPAASLNPNVYGNAVNGIDVTIRIEEQGSGLASNNIYEYGFSSGIGSPPYEWTEYSDTTGAEGFSVTLPDLGSTMDGSYYLWIRQIKDRAGNCSTDSMAAAMASSCHVYGIYVFDNTAPTGTVRYVENNAMLGLYDETITEAPYAVMSISGASDNISGIKGFTLVISDAADEKNSACFAFTEDGDVWTCRFCLYDCLNNPEDVERVRMKVLSEDRLGNVSTLPIMQYDFGTLQTGRPVQAGDIGYSIVEKNAEDNAGETGDASDKSNTAPKYVYERDAFRVEAYVENISYKSSGTAFTGGQLGQLRIYTFGLVHAVSADFGSVKNYLDAAYDINPDLGKAAINPPEKSYLYTHTFFIPLYCAHSTYTDTTAFGYKGSRTQRRSVVYDVSGTLTHDIRTILKYK